MASLKKIANTKIKKSSIIPTFIMGIIIIAILWFVLAAGITFAVNIMLEIEARHYNESTGLVSSFIEKDITSRLDAVNTFAIKNGTADIDSSLGEKFGVANDFGTFDCAYVVTANGVGFDNSGKAVNIKSKSFFKNANPTKAVVCSDSSLKGKIIFISPKIKNFSCEGYFISICSVSYDIPAQYAKDIFEIYIVDDEGNIVSHNELGTDDFDTDSIERASYDGSELTTLYSDYSGDVMTASEQNYLKSKRGAGLAGGFYGDEEYLNFDVSRAITDSAQINIWYRHPIEVNRWSVVSKVKMIRGVSNRDNFTLMLLSIIAGPVLIIIITVIINFATVTGQIVSNRKLISLIFLDAVTGRTNWLKFKADATRFLKKRTKLNYALVSFDICKFRMYVDMYGHSEADKLLVKVSDILSRFIKKRYELATRYSGDTYSVLLTYTDKDNLTDKISALRDALCKVEAKTAIKYHFGVYEIKDRTLSIDRINNLSGMTKDCGANSSVANGISFFDDEMHIKLINEREIENTMDAALEKKEFIVYLQPKYSSVTETISGAEALVRWASEEKGLISPSKFIPVFEKNGFITKLDDYMLNEVCKIQSKWHKNGKTLFPISVNISRAHFENPDLAEHIEGIVRQYDIPYSCIEIELTESAFFDDKALLVETVQRLRNYGFVVSMDDFGSGFSSLNSLKDIPLDIIKLDAGFFNISDNDERSSSIIEDTIKMAKHLNMKTVAEGIETRPQVDFLHSLGCDMIQGYYFSRPMPIDEFERQNGYDNDITEEKSDEEKEPVADIIPQNDADSETEPSDDTVSEEVPASDEENTELADVNE